MKSLVTSIAIMIGPLCVASGFLAIEWQLKQGQEILAHNVKEIHEHVKFHDSKATIDHDNLEKVLLWQDEILAAIRGRKATGLMSLRDPRNFLSGGLGDKFDELATNVSAGR